MEPILYYEDREGDDSLFFIDDSSNHIPVEQSEEPVVLVNREEDQSLFPEGTVSFISLNQSKKSKKRKSKRQKSKAEEERGLSEIVDDYLQNADADFLDNLQNVKRSLDSMNFDDEDVCLGSDDANSQPEAGYYESLYEQADQIDEDVAYSSEDEYAEFEGKSSWNSKISYEEMLERQKFKDRLDGNFVSLTDGGPGNCVDVEPVPKMHRNVLRREYYLQNRVAIEEKRRNTKALNRERRLAKQSKKEELGAILRQQPSRKVSPDLLLFLKAINKDINNFVKQKDAGGYMHLPPMPAGVRRIALLAAEEYYLTVKTFGKGQDKGLILYRTSRTYTPPNWNDLPQRIIARDNGKVKGPTGKHPGGPASKVKSKSTPKGKSKVLPMDTARPASGTVVGGNAAPISKGNVGHQMMLKMGWVQGNALGSSKDGILQPIEVTYRNKRAGLGGDL